ncbi:MAG TPA: hypothetical protein VMZ29_16185 [Candidatus Bathyarchaeia archaeon]|nr:hypothetical protein [Candidatus Bathyarchaeia archaeon]
MKRKAYMIIIIMFFCIIANSWFFKSSNSIGTENFSDILVTCNDEFGFYNGVAIGNNRHFIYLSNYNDKGELIHYSVENGKVMEKNIIQKDGFYINREIYLSVLKDQSFYLIYLASEENESTRLYDHNLYTYYYDDLSNEAEKILLINVNEYFILENHYANPELLGVNILNDEVVFLLSSYNTMLNTTDIYVINLKQATKTIQKYNIDGKFTPSLSCFNDLTNCAYFLYYNLLGNYQFFEYNFTSHTFSDYANCSFSHPSYSLGKGRLLCDPASDNMFFVCPLSSLSSSTDFVLFEYNSTTSSFNLTSTTTNAYASFLYPDSSGELTYESIPEHYDTIIDNSQLAILYCKKIAHSGATQLAFASFSLDESAEWEYTDLSLGDNVNVFHASFIYNSTANDYLDSYLVGYIYSNDSPYHNFGGLTSIISAIGVYGPYVVGIKNPYFIRALYSTSFWLIIASATIIPVILGGVGYYFIRRHIGKKRHSGNNE